MPWKGCCWCWLHFGATSIFLASAGHGNIPQGKLRHYNRGKLVVLNVYGNCPGNSDLFHCIFNSKRHKFLFWILWTKTYTAPIVCGFCISLERTLAAPAKVSWNCVTYYFCWLIRLSSRLHGNCLAFTFSHHDVHALSLLLLLSLVTFHRLFIYYISFRHERHED